jgi:hypothetical protein
MTTDTLAQAIAKWSVAYDKHLNEAKIDLYYEQLKDIDDETMAVLVDRWIADQSHFPRISQIREYADIVRRKVPQIRHAPPSPDGEVTFYCLLCEDTGYEPFKKWSNHYQAEVPYVRRCDCWTRNPKLLSEREAKLRFAGDDKLDQRTGRRP